MKLSEYKNQIKGKRASVIGLGVSNVPLIEFLNKCGVVITARDKKSKEELGDIYDKLASLGVKFVLGDGYLNGIDDDMVFRSPGIRYDIPLFTKIRLCESSIKRSYSFSIARPMLQLNSTNIFNLGLIYNQS